ncbi:MAG TPA: hypothetical protein VLL97_01595 [Acidobacteriota bacterium]|nr:hypothetical protein [Acidobacteriota bacterium]
MQITADHLVVSLPMPICVVVEDIGWWRGYDGSAQNEPYRNRFSRDHCLEDYRALARLAGRLRARVVLGMVLGEWDRRNLLKNVSGATWMGASWDNGRNIGPWVDEAATFLRDNSHLLELACHGLCHEFWHNGRMERSEFHDLDCRMRPPEIVNRHLDAYFEIFADNGLPGAPRIFLPPAMLHSFDSGDGSPQSILHRHGIRHVVTRFSRARWYAEPPHEKFTRECGVGILERGMAPVPWHTASAPAAWDFSNPVLPLHWGNLIHHDPERNFDIVDRWADLLEHAGRSLDYHIAADFLSCWKQAVVFHTAEIAADRGSVIIRPRVPAGIPDYDGTVIVKITCPPDRRWRCSGAEIVETQNDVSGITVVRLRLLDHRETIRIFSSALL